MTKTYLQTLAPPCLSPIRGRQEEVKHCADIGSCRRTEVSFVDIAPRAVTARGVAASVWFGGAAVVAVVVAAAAAPNEWAGVAADGRG